MLPIIQTARKNAWKTAMSAISSIALSGLNDAAARVSNAANNIANMTTTSKLPTAGGAYTGYKAQDVVTLSLASGGAGQGVTSTVQPTNPSYQVAPGTTSPYANANGLVAAPNINLTTDMVSLSTAQFSYGANAEVIKTDDRMQKTLLNTVS
jgi:flagellar basal-body rod protein FlgC